MRSTREDSKNEGKNSTVGEKLLKWKACGDTDIGGGRENQDDMFIFERPDLDICIIGILDGHGRDVGQTASAAGRKYLIEYFERNCENLFTDPYNCLVDAITQSLDKASLKF